MATREADVCVRAARPRHAGRDYSADFVADIVCGLFAYACLWPGSCAGSIGPCVCDLKWVASDRTSGANQPTRQVDVYLGAPTTTWPLLDRQHSAWLTSCLLAETPAQPHPSLAEERVANANSDSVNRLTAVSEIRADGVSGHGASSGREWTEPVEVAVVRAGIAEST